MSVANELTSDVATFVLTKGALHTQTEAGRLLVEFHSTLRKFALEERRRRLARLAPENPSPSPEKATLINN